MRFNLSKERVETIKEYFVRLMTGKLHFDAFEALRNVSLTIEKGEAVALIGANGCGKKHAAENHLRHLYPHFGKADCQRFDRSADRAGRRL